MSKDVIEMTGKVIEILPSATFKVEIMLDGKPTGNTVLGHLAGKMRKNRIRIILHDIVDLEISPYDVEKARIVYRHK